MNQNKAALYKVAAYLLKQAFVAVVARDGHYSYDTVSAEIDRRVSILTEGWVKDGQKWHKDFATSSDLMDCLRIMNDLGVMRIKNGGDKEQPITDDTTRLTMADQDRQRLFMVLEGRMTEIER